SITITSRSSLRAESKLALLSPVIATRAPSSKNRRAVSSPIPLVPPVIKARFPRSLGMTEDCIGVNWKHGRAETDFRARRFLKFAPASNLGKQIDGTDEIRSLLGVFD